MAKAWWRDSDYELFARLTKERDEARAEVERLMHQLADQTNETTRARLEAKREIEALTDERDELLKAYAKAYDEWDHSKYSRAEVAVAYRRGAEAMREACAQAIHGGGLVWTRESAERSIRALPIPEEP
jgi:hypothetical protein